MAATGSDTVSVVERTRPIEIDGGIVGAHFLGRTAAFVLGEEAIVLAPPDGEPRRVGAHGGAILATVADDRRVITAGDDGKIVATDAQGASSVLASDPKHRWIDHVALGPDGVVAWSAGKTAYVKARELREFEAPSTVGGLAFFPKGLRLAIAHYNGATLWFPNAAGASQLVLWPFQGKDGPMGKTPRLLTPSGHRVDIVACHPGTDVVAAGYNNGLLLLARIEDGAEILAKKPGDAAVTALAWSGDGRLLAWGTENGEAGIVNVG